ncbi:hypothetical protein F4810DRAFT_723862 [Camillea tinctor]|nr:hypothetical protein F4810DRAFT_723862 [Camillea tinctor]
MVHLWVHRSGNSWAWLVQGTFYDDGDNKLWHIEVFLGCRDEDDDTEADADVVSEPDITSDTSTTQDTDIVYQYLPPGFSVDNNTNPNLYYKVPEPWDFDVEALFGSVPNSNNPTTNGFPRTNLPPEMAAQGAGWNTRFGWDNADPGIQPIPVGYQQPGWNSQQPVWSPQQVGPTYVTPANGCQHPVPVFPGQVPRWPQPHPVVQSDAPAAHLANSTGGAGCEPGYNYFFPAEHTKIHVIKSTTPPWRVPATMALHYGAYHVPARTTVAELLAGFGAVNPSRKMNKVTEVLAGGNGKWYKGLTISGDEKEELKKTLKDIGWDGTRTGRSGEKPVVWLWITKD